METSTQDIQNKTIAVKKVIEEDLKAADLKWSLFVAAANGFRHETCLKPFPPMFMKDGERDYDALTDTIDCYVPLGKLVKELDKPAFIAKNTKLIALFHFVLVQLDDPKLKTVPPEEFDAVLKRAESVQTDAAKPQYVFEVVSCAGSQAEAHWRGLAEGKRTFYAYHGSKLENFHSILHYGLQQHMNKTGVFGCGTYLSTELSVSVVYSPGGLAWPASCLGVGLSCLALCQLIQAPASHSSHSHTTTDSSMRGLPERPLNNAAGEVPEKYHVVSNNDLVRVRYLLVYAHEPPAIIHLPPSRSGQGGLLKWVGEHKLLSVLLGYIVMLGAVGFAHNHSLQYYYRMLCKKLTDLRLQQGTVWDKSIP